MTGSLFDDTAGGYADVWPAAPSPALQAVIVEQVIHVGRDRSALDIVYVGRTFAGRTDLGFGNPFALDGDDPIARAHLLGAYHRWLTGPDTAARRVLARIRSGEVAGHVVGCWCFPKLCHGMIIAGLAAGLDDDVAAWAAALTAAS